MRGDWAFGEQILDIADNTTDDSFNNKTGKLTVNKELVLRSKIRIEARQFHMSRLHREAWGENQTIDIKNDSSLLTEEERRRKADELIAMIRENTPSQRQKSHSMTTVAATDTTSTTA